MTVLVSSLDLLYKRISSWSATLIWFQEQNVADLETGTDGEQGCVTIKDEVFGYKCRTCYNKTKLLLKSNRHAPKTLANRYR